MAVPKKTQHVLTDVELGAYLGSRVECHGLGEIDAFGPALPGCPICRLQRPTLYALFNLAPVLFSLLLAIFFVKVGDNPSALLGLASAVERGRPLNGQQANIFIDAQAAGLVCDGKSDNAPILDALHDRTVRQAGLTVIFPSATLPCLSSRPLVATSRTTYSASPGTFTLKPTLDTKANPLLFLASNVTEVRVVGLVFDGDGDRTFGSNNLIVVFRSNHVVFNSISVRNAAGTGIVFSSGVSESGVRNSSVASVGSRWKITGLKDDQRQGVAFCCGSDNVNNFVVDSRFKDVGLDAISFSDQVGFRAIGNRLFDIGGALGGVVGAELQRKTSDHGLIGGAAIYGASSVDTQVADNVADGAGGNGIDLYRVSNATIIGNRTVRSGGNGIAFAAGTNATIANNVSCDNNQARLSTVSAPQAGVFLTGGLHGDPPVTDVVISGNTIADDQPVKTQNYGIQFQAGSRVSNIQINRNNRIFGNALAKYGEAATVYEANQP
jgi:hypothetical protein